MMTEKISPAEFEDENKDLEILKLLKTNLELAKENVILDRQNKQLLEALKWSEPAHNYYPLDEDTIATHAGDEEEMDIDEMEAGREMDTLIAEKITKWIPRNTIEIPHYSTDIAAAWMVLQKFCDEESHNYPQDVCLEWNGFKWFCYVNTEQMLNVLREPRDGRAASAPLAICRAALKAVEE